MVQSTKKKPGQKEVTPKTDQPKEAKTKLVFLGSGIFSVSSLGGDILSFLKDQKCTFPSETILQQKITLLQDLSYFQRNLILHFLFNRKDMDSNMATLPQFAHPSLEIRESVSKFAQDIFEIFGISKFVLVKMTFIFGFSKFFAVEKPD